MKIEDWKLIQIIIVPIDKCSSDQVLAVGREVEVVAVSLTMREASQRPSLLLKQRPVRVIDLLGLSSFDVIKI